MLSRWLQPSRLSKSLASAEQTILQEQGSTEELSAVHLNTLIRLCTSFNRTGCVLAWMVIAGTPSLTLDSYIDEFTYMWLQDTAKNKPAGGRSKGAALPFREGELLDLVEAYQGLALTNVVDAAQVTKWSGKAWVYLAMMALNRLAGWRARPEPGRWSLAERTSAQSLASAVQRRGDADLEIPTSEERWQRDMRSRCVGYGGEEISICHVLTLDQTLPALPPLEHGGCINALDWVSARTQDLLLNPKLLLKKPEDIVLPKMPGKVHMDPKDRMAIAEELVRRHVCEWIPLDKVYRVGSTVILNGLFGVSKPSCLEDGRPILRFIMNLVGSNSTQLQMEGGCSSLPNITAWQSIVLDGSEILKIHQSDMSSAFYLFRLPACWRPHLAFNILVDGKDISGTEGITYALSCAVIPMGWLNSVGIMQEISENLFKTARMDPRNQISRGAVLPPWMNEFLNNARAVNKSWWHIYLDNYAGGERVLPNEDAEGAKAFHAAAEEAWRDAGVVSADKKRVSGALRATELGAEVNGESKTLGISTDKLVSLIQATLWLLNQKTLVRKYVQILAGRWVFALQFRRPAMSFLQKTWQLVGGNVKVTASLRKDVRAELLSLIFASPLLHCFFRCWY